MISLTLILLHSSTSFSLSHGDIWFGGGKKNPVGYILNVIFNYFYLFIELNIIIDLTLI